jgi:hypothetical protein
LGSSLAVSEETSIGLLEEDIFDDDDDFTEEGVSVVVVGGAVLGLSFPLLLILSLAELFECFTDLEELFEGLSVRLSLGGASFRIFFLLRSLSLSEGGSEATAPAAEPLLVSLLPPEAGLFIPPVALTEELEVVVVMLGVAVVGVAFVVSVLLSLESVLFLDDNGFTSCAS